MKTPKPLEVDILQLEIDKRLPNWLSPAADVNNPNRKAIRDKHRAKYLADKKSAKDRK